MSLSVKNIFVGDGSAMPTAGGVANPTNIAAGDVAVIKRDQTIAATGITIADTDEIIIAQGTSESNAKGFQPIKRSMVIPGRSITKFEGQSFQNKKRAVWSIGYSRYLAAGDIAVSNSTQYVFSAVIKTDKTIHSERPYRFGFSFTSAAAATQFTIATQIAALINGQTGLKDMVIAIVTGDGTGVYGVTGATNFGVEVAGKDLTADNTGFMQEIVDFALAVDDSSGFAATTECAQIQGADYGTGTYAQLYNMENFAAGYEGVLNRRQWPIPTITIAASSTPVLSAAIVPTATTPTLGEDKITFSASVQGILVAGDLVEIDSVNYEIKFFQSGSYTICYLNTVTTTVGAGGKAVKKRLLYDLVNIEFTNPNMLVGAGAIQDNSQAVVIAMPAITAGGAYNSQSTGLASLMNVLNPYMASLGFSTVTV
jgi:hypothetical protein